MSRPSQTESAYVQTILNGKCLCADILAFTRLSYVDVQPFMRSPNFRAFISRLSCVHQTFMRSCPDFRAFTRLSCVQVQTFVRSYPEFRAFTDTTSVVSSVKSNGSLALTIRKPAKSQPKCRRNTYSLNEPSDNATTSEQPINSIVPAPPMPT